MKRIEHQSTISENLPLRLLMYYARVMEKFIDSEAVFKQELIKIPTPEFIVLYNGLNDYPSEKTLRLSDAFMEIPGYMQKFGKIELTVRVFNINIGYNEDLKKNSESLSGYSTFVGLVKDYRQSGMELKPAI